MSSCIDIVALLAKALSTYFSRRGPAVAGYIPITRQPEVKVALRAIARHYEGSEEYPLLSDALEGLGRERLFSYIQERLGWRLVLEGGEEYLAIPSGRYVEYVGAPQDVFRRLLEGLCHQG